LKTKIRIELELEYDSESSLIHEENIFIKKIEDQVITKLLDHNSLACGYKATVRKTKLEVTYV
jgi:hypothetical protein